MDEFDLLVIGTGSGLDVANAAIEHGQSAAIVEKSAIGGTCLNRGCIPSKLLLYHARVHRTIERAEEFGIDATIDDVDFEGIVRSVTDEVEAESDAIRHGLRASTNHVLYEGEGRFVDDRTVEIVDGIDAGSTVRGDDVLVAAGTRPDRPDVDGLDSIDVATSDDALRWTTPPDRLVVVGGGYVAAELAHFFGTFGSDVTIVGRRPFLLPDADEEIAAAFTERYAERFDVHTGYEATAASTGGDEIRVEAEPSRSIDGTDSRVEREDAEPITVAGDRLLVATGRVPNTDVLDVEAAGIETDDEGFVAVDEYLRASADGVWALGDVVGEYQLKHVANHEARTVARNLLGDGLEPIDYAAIPFAVFGEPEVAGVGATEGQLRDADRAYATRVQRFEDTARGNAMKVNGLAKAIVTPDGEILGFHLLGPDASTLLEEVVVAMKAGSGTVADLRKSVHVHPALSEVVQRAFAGQFQRDGAEHEHAHRHDHDRQ